jgi:hypothetical protein
MNGEQMKKMLEELTSIRKEHKEKIGIKDYDKLINFDFASLYPSSMKMVLPTKQGKRKKKIKKIFDI